MDFGKNKIKQLNVEPNKELRLYFISGHVWILFIMVAPNHKKS
jgi:hypothetical protein